MEDVIKKNNRFYKKKKSLRVNEEKINKINIKSLLNHWGKIIDVLIEDGNHNFGITINLPQNSIYLVESYISECLDDEYIDGNSKINFTGQN